MVLAISYEVVHLVAGACGLSALSVTHVMSVTVLLQMSRTEGMTVYTACLLCGLQLDER